MSVELGSTSCGVGSAKEHAFARPVATLIITTITHRRASAGANTRRKASLKADLKRSIPGMLPHSPRLSQLLRVDEAHPSRMRVRSSSRTRAPSCRSAARRSTRHRLSCSSAPIRRPSVGNSPRCRSRCSRPRTRRDAIDARARSHPRYPRASDRRGCRCPLRIKPTQVGPTTTDQSVGAARALREHHGGRSSTNDSVSYATNANACRPTSSTLSCSKHTPLSSTTARAGTACIPLWQSMSADSPHLPPFDQRELKG